VLRVSASAIVQDWFITPGGSEQVAQELARILPTAEMYTSFADRSSLAALGARLHPWPIQRIAGLTKRHRSLLPLYPLWFGGLDLRHFDLVVSSSSAFAHAVRTRFSATHIAYIHTPMRYAYDIDAYLHGSSLSLPSRAASRLLAGPLRRWSRAAAQRPDILVANSEAVRDRIRRYWDRDAEIIHPPVEVDSIAVSDEDKGYLLLAARLLAYRRVDLAVEACTGLGRDLVVVGDGPERARLERQAGPTVRFVGSVDRPTLISLFRACSRYLVPGIEDFGIAPVEAMAAGKPVIAFRGGGAAETVLDGETGVLFDEGTADALAQAIVRADGLAFDRGAIRKRAEVFATPVFHRRVGELFERLGVSPDLYRTVTTAP
jgi:glycosyltransferase involved in cell wall biosynthesis